MVKVDDSPPEMTVVDKPDAFSRGRKKTIYMQVANPRSNSLKNIILDVSGNGITAIPSRVWVGTVAPAVKMPVNFTITPDTETTVHLALNYDNGDNPHALSMDLPVTFGTDKKQAAPVVSNIEVKPEGGIYHITGDVNNAGLETANTVMVTTRSPAVPEDPYKTYVVGALKPDDFGSFEVTFSVNDATSIPLEMSYKDADGNIYTSVQDVRIQSVTNNSKKDGTGPNFLFIAVAVIALAAFIGGWIIYLKRKKT